MSPEDHNTRLLQKTRNREGTKVEPYKMFNALAYFLKYMSKTDHWSVPEKRIRRKCHQNTEIKHNLSVT